MKPYRTLLKREFLLILPMALAFVFLVLLNQNSIAIAIDNSFAEAVVRPTNTRGTAELLVRNFSVSPWMFIWVIALAFMQYAGFDNLFAASWPVKRGAAVGTKLVCAVLAYTPGLIAYGGCMTVLRAKNLDYLTDSFAAYSDSVYAALTDSVSVHMIVWQTALCFLSLTAVYALTVLMMQLVRYRALAVLLAVCALFYFPLLFECAATFLVNADGEGSRLGEMVRGFCNTFDFTKLSQGLTSPLQQQAIGAAADRQTVIGAGGEILANTLPAAEVYRFDWAATRAVFAIAIIVFLLYLCFRAYRSEAAFTAKVFLTPAVGRTFLIAAVLWCTVVTAYAIQDTSTYRLYQFEHLMQEEARRATDSEDPFKQAFVKELTERFGLSYSERPNMLRANVYSRAEFDAIAAAIEALGMDEFLDFVSRADMLAGHGAFTYRGPHDVVILFELFPEQEYYPLTIYLNSMAEASAADQPLIDAMREAGYYLGDRQTGGTYEVLAFVEDRFLTEAMGNGYMGMTVRSQTGEPYVAQAIVYRKDGQIAKLKMVFACPPSEGSAVPQPDTDVIDAFVNAAGGSAAYTYDTTARYMTQYYYEWYFLEVNIRMQ